MKFLTLRFHLFALSSILDEMPAVESIHSSNSSEPFKPFNIPLGSSFSLAPAESLEVSLTFHALDFTQKDIHLLLLYREVCMNIKELHLYRRQIF